MVSYTALCLSLLIVTSSQQVNGLATRFPSQMVSKSLSRIRPRLQYSDSHSHSHLDQHTNTLKRFASRTRGFSTVILKPLTVKSTRSTAKRSKIGYDFSTEDNAVYASICLNSLLFISKLIAGVRCNSKALIADAVYSISGLLNDFSNLWSIRFGTLREDKEFSVVARKLKAMGSLFFNMFFVAAGMGIGSLSLYSLVKSSLKGTSTGAFTTPVALTVVTGLSILCERWFYRKANSLGEKVRSAEVISNAKHHKRNLCSSILVLGSVVVSNLSPRLRLVDYGSAVLIALGIIGTGAKMLVDPAVQLTGAAGDEVTKRASRLCVHQQMENEDICSLTDDAAILFDGLSPCDIQEIEDYLINEIMNAHQYACSSNALSI